MAPELFPSVPGAVSGVNRKEAEDRVTEKVGPEHWHSWQHACLSGQQGRESMMCAMRFEQAIHFQQLTMVVNSRVYVCCVAPAWCMALAMPLTQQPFHAMCPCICWQCE